MVQKAVFVANTSYVPCAFHQGVLSHGQSGRLNLLGPGVSCQKLLGPPQRTTWSHTLTPLRDKDCYPALGWCFRVGSRFQGIHIWLQICKKLAVLAGASTETPALQSAVTRSSSPSEDCEGLSSVGPCKIVCGAEQTQQNKS